VPGVGEEAKGEGEDEDEDEGEGEDEGVVEWADVGDVELEGDGEEEDDGEDEDEGDEEGEDDGEGKLEGKGEGDEEDEGDGDGEGKLEGEREGEGEDDGEHLPLMIVRRATPEMLLQPPDEAVQTSKGDNPEAVLRQNAPKSAAKLKSTAYCLSATPPVEANLVQTAKR
jgi:hypothetical protein